jgi:hypothetical protein
MAFDDTYTDRDFERGLRNANKDWLDQVARCEPDLDIDGMRKPLLARLLSFFGGNAAQ